MLRGVLSFFYYFLLLSNIFYFFRLWGLKVKLRPAKIDFSDWITEPSEGEEWELVLLGDNQAGDTHLVWGSAAVTTGINMLQLTISRTVDFFLYTHNRNFAPSVQSEHCTNAHCSPSVSSTEHETWHVALFKRQRIEHLFPSLDEEMGKWHSWPDFDAAPNQSLTAEKKEGHASGWKFQSIYWT